MVEETIKPWYRLTRAEKEEGLAGILLKLERLQRGELRGATLGEWWASWDYMRYLTIFAYSVLEKRDRKKPIDRRKIRCLMVEQAWAETLD